MENKKENTLMTYKLIDLGVEIQKCLRYPHLVKKQLNILETPAENIKEECLNRIKDYIIGIDNKSLCRLIIDELKQKKMFISCAESCTGGMIISRLIGQSGASDVIEESYVTYSNQAKMRILGVKEETIKNYTVTSLETAKEMAEGILKITNADIAVSVTGFAGSGNEKLPTDGLCYFCILVRNNQNLNHLEKIQVEGNRNECRYGQSNYILWRVLQILRKL